mgnify:CR=1 FL=1
MMKIRTVLLLRQHQFQSNYFHIVWWKSNVHYTRIAWRRENFHLCSRECNNIVFLFKLSGTHLEKLIDEWVQIIIVISVHSQYVSYLMKNRSTIYQLLQSNQRVWLWSVFPNSDEKKRTFSSLILSVLVIKLRSSLNYNPMPLLIAIIQRVLFQRPFHLTKCTRSLFF